MYRKNKDKKGKNTNKSRSLTLIIALLTVLCIAAGGTLAFLTVGTEPIKNLFNPGKVTTEIVETLESDVKSQVMVKNTGNVDAYIRAAVIISWKDDEGNVFAEAPKAGSDYEIDYNRSEDGWTLSEDGFFYWTPGPVAKNKTTGVLIKTCKPKSDTTPEGCHLSVEILGSGIQAKGVNGESISAVEDAWRNAKNKLSLNENGSLSVAAAAEQGGGA